MQNNQFSLLWERRFGPLFLAQFLGAFNDNVFKNALVILITYYAADKLGMDTRILVTAAAGLFIVPYFFFSALAGQLADKYDKSILIQRVKLAEIVLMLIAAAGFMFESVHLLLTVLFLMGTQSTFFGPLKYAILPDHLKEDELIGANGIIEAGTFLAILLGTILGGIVILKTGGVYWISGLTVLIALIGWQGSRFIPPTKANLPDLKINKNIMAETWRIVQHTRKTEDVFLSILGISWFWLVGFVFLAQFPIYGKDILGGNEDVVTLLLTTFSVGIAGGSLLCEKLLKGEVSGVYAPFGALGMALFIGMLWLVSPAETIHTDYIGIMDVFATAQNWLMLFSLVMIAACGGIYIVPLYAIMQSRCDQTHRARTIAANNILNAVFMATAAVMTMVLLKLNLTVTDIFLVLGILNVPVSYIVYRIVKIQRAKRLAHA